MRDKFLAYALAVSVGVHLVILGVVGVKSASRPAHVQEEVKAVEVTVVKAPDDEPQPEPVVLPEPKPAPETVVEEQPKPVKATKPAPTPEFVPENEPETAKPAASKPTPKPAAPKPAPKPVSPSTAKRPTSQTNPASNIKPTTVASSKQPGNPGGDLNLGSGSSRGQDMGGGGGKTPVGWVPGDSGGTGMGSGKGAGVGKPEPVPDAVEGPGKEPAPAPPPPPDVDVRVCAESGLLPVPNCESTKVKSYRPGNEPGSKCTSCQPRHVSKLADRSTPELISGSKRPKYPSSAKEQGIEGSVTVEYTIDTEGRVTGMKVTSSSGSSLLDDAAIDTVKSRKYKPAVQGGIPRNYKKRETFHFALS